MSCGEPRKLEKHHFLDGNSIVYVLRVCRKCNMHLPSVGLVENKEAMKLLKNDSVHETNEAKTRILGLLYNNWTISQNSFNNGNKII